MSRADNDRVGQRRAVRVAGAQRDGFRRVLVRRHRLTARHRRVVDRGDRNRHRRDVRIDGAVVRFEREAVAAVVVRRRRVGHRRCRAAQRAVRRADNDRVRQRRAVRIAGTQGDGFRRVLIRRHRLAAGDRGIVDRRDRNRHRRARAAAVAIADRVAEAVRAAVVRRRRIGDGAAGIADGRAVRRQADTAHRERVAVRIAVVGEHGDRQRGVFRGRPGIGDRDRLIVDRRHGDRHRRDVRVGFAVVGLVGEAVGAAEVRGRRVREAASRVQGQRAVRRTADQDRAQAVAVGVAVVAQHAGSRGRQRLVFGDRVRIVRGHRRPVGLRGRRRERPGRTGRRDLAVVQRHVPLVVGVRRQPGPCRARARAARHGGVAADHRVRRALHVVVEHELAGRVGLEIAARHRVGERVDLVLRGLERVVAQPAVAAVGAILVVGQHLVHRLPAVVQIGAPSLTRVVAVDHHEHVAVRLDDLLPHRLGGRAVRAELRRGRPRVRGVHERVRAEDDAPVRIALDDLVGPRHRVVRPVEIDVNDEKVEAADREELVVVLVLAVDRIVGFLSEVAAVPRESLEPRHREVLIVKAGDAGRALVVIARRHPVRNAAGVEDRHAGAGALPLELDRVDVLRQVAELRDERNVHRHLIGDDPVGLGRERAGERRVVDVVLRVGDRDQGEVGRGDALLPSVERRRHLVAVGVGDRDVERRGRAAGAGVGRRDQHRRRRRGVDDDVERCAVRPREVAAGNGAVDARAAGHRRAGVVVEAPASEQTGAREDLAAHAVGDLLRRPGDAPDADFVDRAGEESRRGAARVERAADRRMLDAVGARRLSDRHGCAVGHAVQIELPLRPVVGGGPVIPDVVQDRRHAGGWMIEAGSGAGRPFLEVRREHVARVDAEEVVHVDVAAVALRTSLGHQRHGGHTAGAGAGRHAGAVAPEPRFERELGRAEPRRGAERHVGVGPPEINRLVGRRRVHHHGQRIGAGQRAVADAEHQHVRARRRERRRRRPVLRLRDRHGARSAHLAPRRHRVAAWQAVVRDRRGERDL